MLHFKQTFLRNEAIWYFCVPEQLAMATFALIKSPVIERRWVVGFNRKATHLNASWWVEEVHPFNNTLQTGIIVLISVMTSLWRNKATWFYVESEQIYQKSTEDKTLTFYDTREKDSTVDSISEKTDNSDGNSQYEGLICTAEEVSYL